MKTAYIELNTTNQIRALTSQQDKPSFLYKGIVFYPNTTVTSLPEILHKNYQYFIVDMGVLNTYTTTEFLCCNKQFLVCSPSKWRSVQINEKIEKTFKNQETNCIQLIMNLSEEKKSVSIFSEWSAQISFPYISNPFHLEPSHFHAISLLLKNL
ncbi:MAG: hypothetical protein IJA07_04155 [Agathobacter sp.]|nr:hypothetical protein [Agathobacter sp.]